MRARTNKNVKEFIIISFSRSKDWAETRDTTQWWSHVVLQSHLWWAYNRLVVQIYSTYFICSVYVVLQYDCTVPIAYLLSAGFTLHVHHQSLCHLLLRCRFSTHEYSQSGSRVALDSTGAVVLKFRGWDQYKGIEALKGGAHDQGGKYGAELKLSECVSCWNKQMSPFTLAIDL